MTINKKRTNMKKIFCMLGALLYMMAITAQTISVAEALTIAGQLTSNTSTTETYTIEGYVNTIETNNFSDSFNNMTFWIADTRGTKGSNSAGALYIYRGRPNVELKAGDKVRVVDKLKNYNGKLETSTTNAPVTLLEAAAVLDTVKGSLRVCAQNLENYYYNLNTGRGNYTPEQFVDKTRKIVNNMLAIDADIYAFCEVEAQPIVLQQLADSANARVEGNPYVAVADGISEAWSADKDYNIKSGFIYRSDRVAPVGVSTGATPGNGYYAHTMRIQTFRQLSSGEKLVVSMNHFKAKDSSADQGEAQRLTNASNLINALANVNADPDILVLGDLNCEYGEAPITNIINAGYEEQILRFDSLAYSHCYGGGELIDHVLANSSMRDQIVCAYVKHVSAYKCNPDLDYSASYSDHDPYVVEINLTTPEQPCEDINATYLTNGLGDWTTDNSTVWRWDNYGYAKGSKQGGYEANLLSPELNMSEMTNISLSFAHAHKFAGTPAEELTLWVTKNYQGTYADSEWQQLTISPYTDNNSWTWQDVTVQVPSSYVGNRTVFAFHYKSTASNYATWEIKNLNLQATCGGATDIAQPATEEKAGKANKVVEDGHIYLVLPNGSKYNIIGQKIQ